MMQTASMRLLILAAVALAGNGVRAVALAAPAPGTATSTVTDATHLEKVHACVYDVSCTGLLVAAHRMGFKGPFENTLWALNQNSGKTTDLLEFSVRETWDGRPIVIHDDTVDRTTNGSGRVRWHTSRRPASSPTRESSRRGSLRSRRASTRRGAASS